MEDKCITCGGHTDGYKCAMCGEEMSEVKADHSCGGENCQRKCSGCNKPASQCDCPATAI